MLTITSFRALQVCAWNVAHRGLSGRSNSGVKFTQLWDSAAHNFKAVCANLASNTTAVEHIHMAQTFGLESTCLYIFLWFYLDRTRHVQFHRLCAAHPAYSVYNQPIRRWLVAFSALRSSIDKQFCNSKPNRRGSTSTRCLPCRFVTAALSDQPLNGQRCIFNVLTNVRSLMM